MDLPGSLGNEPGAQNHTVSDKEGTVQANGQKGKDAGTVAKTGATGAVIGTVASGSAKGAGIGGLAGAAIGLGQVLFTRGQDVRIDQGTALEMVLQRPLTVDVMHTDSARAENDVTPRVTNRAGFRFRPRQPIRSKRNSRSRTNAPIFVEMECVGLSSRWGLIVSMSKLIPLKKPPIPRGFLLATCWLMRHSSSFQIQ